MPERSVLVVAYTPAGGSDVRAAVGGFLRYIQHRDKHPGQEPSTREVEGLVKYVAYRDRTGSRARTFTVTGRATDADRRQFTDFVMRSLRESKPIPRRSPDGTWSDRRRAVYRCILSPERAEGLDLQLLARAAVGRLQEEVGDGQPLQWLAAEHRNTAHPHVHIVLAGMREVAPGRFHQLLITKPRLAAMKEAVLQEIERQRTERGERSVPAPKPLAARTRVPSSERPAGQATRPERASPTGTTSPKPRGRRHPLTAAHSRGWVSGTLRRLAWRYRRETEHLVEEERWRLEREGGR